MKENILERPRFHLIFKSSNRWDFPPSPSFFQELFYTELENVELKPLAQGKDKQKLHVMHVFGGGERGEWDSLPFVIIINNDKADFSEKITREKL